MKTVIVFDTEDKKGMENAYRTILSLAKEYMDLSPSKRIEISRGQLLRILKDFDNLHTDFKLKPALKFVNDIMEKYGISMVEKN